MNPFTQRSDQSRNSTQENEITPCERSSRELSDLSGNATSFCPQTGKLELFYTESPESEWVKFSAALRNA